LVSSVPDHTAEIFTILTVCTANVCRSALAEARLRAWAAQGDHTEVIHVGSAGTQAWAGSPMCTEGADLVGQQAETHLARELTTDLLASADLVLVADRSHRATAARLYPRGRALMFTLTQAALISRELTGILERGELPDGAPALPDAPVPRLRWATGELDAGRALVSGQDDLALDIVDQHGPEPHPQALDQVIGSIESITNFMDIALLMKGH